MGFNAPLACSWQLYHDSSPEPRLTLGLIILPRNESNMRPRLYGSHFVPNVTEKNDPTMVHTLHNQSHHHAELK